MIYNYKQSKFRDWLKLVFIKLLIKGESFEAFGCKYNFDDS